MVHEFVSDDIPVMDNVSQMTCMKFVLDDMVVSDDVLQTVWHVSGDRCSEWSR